MKKLSLIIAGAAIVGFAGMASAETPAPEGNAFGVYGCNSPSSPDASNPGKWLKGLKNNEAAWTFGLNPAEIRAGLEAAGGPTDENVGNVGEMLDNYCDDPN